MKIFRIVLIFVSIGVPLASSAFAVSGKEFAADYPPSQFILGIGEIKDTGDFNKNRIMSAMLARNEIATQIRVHVESEMVDKMCGNQDASCKDEVSMVIKNTVSEILAGSKIVKTGEEHGKFYCVAVMPRKETEDAVLEKAAVTLREK